MILPCLYVGHSKDKDRGVFASEDIAEGTIIEISPVIVMGKEERAVLDKTRLHDYIFEWGNDKCGCCVALGYVSIYNHSYRSNCEYEMDYAEQLIRIKTVHYVKAGDELCINYNGDFDSKKPVWFDAR
ncbi:MAG: SET domain-containing protein-lysine N-methyltransferase [Bacteroidetes bacterium]|nr:SET domain-containing protein-lysine N-methyltransferase [Bacteroidota bacterium]MBS1975512.1 SET domain-containing protein-lysine N-methyltransferase [Bacteroidota bacterium]